jgi:type IV/VI secretion system ImpK/VasF family protein
VELLQVCDPLFQYVCRVSRSVRKRAVLDVNEVRGAVTALLDDMRVRCADEPELAAQFRLVELPLIFFVDFTFRTMPEFGGGWRDLASELNPPQRTGDEKFFDLLDEALADRSEGARERIAVFYTCLGLGFTGWYSGQPDLLRRKMLECASRLRGVIDPDDAQLCPDAYQHVNGANLVRPPAAGVTGILIALIGVTVSVFVAYGALYHRYSSDLTQAVSAINASASKALEQAPTTRRAASTSPE